MGLQLEDIVFIYSGSVAGWQSFNLLYDLENLLQKQVDLVSKKSLKNPYLIESINESKIQLI